MHFFFCCHPVKKHKFAFAFNRTLHISLDGCFVTWCVIIKMLFEQSYQGLKNIFRSEKSRSET